MDSTVHSLSQEKNFLMTHKHRVFPVERAGSLNTIFRRWVQNPHGILRPYIKEGMSVLDFGCGPGYFTLEMARMVGASGRVIACDLQDGMLEKLRAKVKACRLDNVISMHKCSEDRIGVAEAVDFVLAFYILHEVPDQGCHLSEIRGLLKSDGKLLVVEPTFRVSKSEFDETVMKTKNAGLVPVEAPRIFLSRAAVFRMG
jgi:ubiquinone/menaquinone biosynthesis C-methylase UbiE